MVMAVLFAAWLLLSLPIAVLVGMGIALGSRPEAALVTPYPTADVESARRRDAAS